MLHVSRLILLLIPGLYLSHTVYSQSPDNLPVCAAPDGQFLPRAVSDGSGGTIVVWEDYRTGKDWDVYAQRIDARGARLWDGDGIPICREKGNQRYLRMVRSGDGMVVAWTDRRSGGNWDVYAQAIDLSGRTLWAATGAPVCANTADQSTVEILSDGEGGAVIIWEDERRSAEFQDLYIQRLNADGEAMWENNGAPLFPSDTLQSNATLISDDAGGFYVIWWDVIGYDQWSIMAYRLDLNGKPRWKTPIRVSPPEGMQGDPRTVSDEQGGVIVVWQNYDNFINDDLYAQRINRDGEKQWGESGVVVCDAPGIQKHASVVSDGGGGIVAVWNDARDVYSDLYAQRISADGKPQWRTNGVPICVAEGHQDKPFVVQSGADEFFVAWLDYREDYGAESKDAIYSQRLDSDGKRLHPEAGVPICTADGVQQPPYVVGMESVELAIIWSDARRDLGDIYVHCVR